MFFKNIKNHEFLSLKYVVMFLSSKRFYINACGSVVECLTQDRGEQV